MGALPTSQVISSRNLRACGAFTATDTTSKCHEVNENMHSNADAILLMLFIAVLDRQGGRFSARPAREELCAPVEQLETLVDITVDTGQMQI